MTLVAFHRQDGLTAHGDVRVTVLTFRARERQKGIVVGDHRGNHGNADLTAELAVRATVANSGRAIDGARVPYRRGGHAGITASFARCDVEAEISQRGVICRLGPGVLARNTKQRGH